MQLSLRLFAPSLLEHIERSQNSADTDILMQLGVEKQGNTWMVCADRLHACTELGVALGDFHKRPNFIPASIQNDQDLLPVFLALTQVETAPSVEPVV